MRLLILLGCLWAAAVSAQTQTQTETTAPPLTPVEDAEAAPPPAPAPPANAEAPTEPAPPRDRAFVRNAGVSAALLGGGALVGGIAGGVGGAIGGVFLGALFGPFAIVAMPGFAILFGSMGILAGAVVGAGLGWLSSLFFIPPLEVDYELPRNVISVAPLDLLSRRFSIEYERRLTAHVALSVRPTFEVNSAATWLWRGGTGQSIAVGASVYPWGQAPRGAFVSLQGHVGLGDFQHADAPAPSRDTFGGAALTLGHSWLIARHFDLSVGLGAAYQASNGFVTGHGWQTFHEVTPTLRLNLGAAF